MFEAGERVFLPGSSGEPTAILETLFASEADILTSFVPGVNSIPVGCGARIASLFGQKGTRALPCGYGAFARDLGNRVMIDTTVVQVSPPNEKGIVSFGPAVEFGPAALRAAARRIAVINHAVAFSAASPSMAIRDFHSVIESDTPIPDYAAGAVDPTSSAIAARVAEVIPDGAALQIGLGKVPSALLPLLTDRRGLRLRTGMASSGIELLAAAGALDPDWPHLSTVFLGDRTLYDWAADQSLIRLVGCETTHDPCALAAVDGLVAINSALQVDLLGQCNLEFAAGRQVSGCGGSPDFARAARLSSGGLSVVALPASFAGGSRIVARIGSDAAVTLPRHDVDLIVTEHGIADLRGKDAPRRAEAIIGVADPATRVALERAWRRMAGDPAGFQASADLFA